MSVPASLNAHWQTGLLNMEGHQSWPISRFLSTSYNGLKHQNNPCVTCPASQSPEKNAYTKYRILWFSCFIMVPGFRFIFCSQQTSKRGWQGLHKVSRERNKSRLFFHRDGRTGRAWPGVGLCWQISLTSTDTSADPSSVSSLFVHACVRADEALWTTHTSNCSTVAIA